MTVPPILRALVGYVTDPVVVARDAPSFAVVAASASAATLCAENAAVGAPLAAWIGEPAADELRRALAAGRNGGQTEAGRWTTAGDGSDHWIIFTLEQSADVPTSRRVGFGPDPGSSAAVRVAAYEAALAVATELEPGAVLQRIVDLARTVVPAKFAALGVSNAQGRIEQFITAGLTSEERDAIGPIPEGHGMLGELIRDRVPLLVPDIAADSRSVGFPANHPPMRTLLGTPILLGERVLGNLYLTERLDGRPFDEDDLATVQVLAAHAATAIERAQLYRQVEISRKRAEEQRDQLRVILDSLPTGVMIVGAGGALELANAATMEMVFGHYAPRGTMPVIGRDFDLFQPDGAPLPSGERPSFRALRGEAVRNRQLLLRGSDGSRLPILVQAAPLRSAVDEVDRAVVVVQDVTRLREAEQLKDDFLSLISHEIRTPLTAIHGGAHMLANQGHVLDEQTRQDLLEDIVVESGRLERMLTNLLSLTAIMAGRFVANTEPVLVGPLARQVAREVAERSPEHRFVVDIPSDLPPAEGDPALLSQVLRNLYENGVKYAPGGGEIRTTAAADADSVAVRVTDQGIGIAPDQVGRIFERFHRAATDSKVRGMGLGLYISRNLVEAMGGRIEAASAGVGQGSTFSVTMPTARGE